MLKNKLFTLLTIGLMVNSILLPSNISFAKGRFHKITVKVFEGEKPVENARLSYVQEGQSKEADVTYDSEKMEYSFTASGGGGYTVKVKHDADNYYDGQSKPFKLNGESEDPAFEIHLVARGELSVSGYVKDKDGNPLKDASVLLESYPAKTDENGYYEIKKVAGGNYTIGAYLSKYTMVQGQPDNKINLSESAENVNFVLDKAEEENPESKFQISGIVTFNGVLAAQNSVKVTLTKEENTVETYVNENGCYKFTPNGGGKYTIKVFKGDKELASRETQLKGEQQTEGKIMVLEDFNFLVPTVAVNTAAGLYNKAQSVELTINNNVPGKIKYSFDGQNFSDYSQPVAVDVEGKTGSKTLWYYAVSSENENLQSDIEKQEYTFDKEAPIASSDIKGGLYNTDKKVNLTMSEEGTVYYTLDGTDPTEKSQAYEGTIDINKTSTLKFMAIDKAGNKSGVYKEEYTIDKVAPTATADVNGGTYYTSKKVTLTMSEKGTIYYTVDGTTPTKANMVYNGPVTINKTTTLNYIVVDSAGNISQVYTQKYIIKAANSVLPKTGDYSYLLEPLAMIFIAAGIFMAVKGRSRRA